MAVSIRIEQLTCRRPRRKQHEEVECERHETHADEDEADPSLTHDPDDRQPERYHQQRYVLLGGEGDGNGSNRPAVPIALQQCDRSEPQRDHEHLRVERVVNLPLDRGCPEYEHRGECRQERPSPCSTGDDECDRS